MKNLLVPIMLILCCTLAACKITDSDAAPLPLAQTPDVSGKIQCKEPRPQACIEIYRPVCAVRDTGIRCITTPCPSIERVTYGNACSACADKAVFAYKAGACEAKNN